MEKVLFVDDEPNILSSYRREFRDKFHMETAESGREALEVINGKGPFAVVVSDLKMPEMDGIRFLSKVRETYPDTVRMILTGYADLQNTMDSVNEGYVFRLLTKPCPAKTLEKAIDAGMKQHRLILAGRELHALKNLKQALEGMVLGFSTLVEIRDPYTAGHQRRVTTLAVAIAEAMGLDENRITGLRMAAMIHDIGKIYVPAEFLNKPGKLSEAEFMIIKMHPQVGYDILKSVDFAWPVSEMVYQHHEKINGSGYPRGLLDKEILPEAKIIAVADVVEAMAAHRPYRPALGIEKALKEIEDNRGTLFDPKAVDVCVGLFRDKKFEFNDP